MSLWLFFLYILIGIGSSQLLPTSEEKIYDTKYDNINIDELLDNERLLKNYIKCLEDKGPCTPDAKLLKETLPDAILTNCSKCSEKQKYGADRITHYLIDQRPQDWERLAKIYDPDNIYRQNYLDSKILITTIENQKSAEEEVVIKEMKKTQQNFVGHNLQERII